MSAPDGLEQRTADQDERSARDEEFDALLSDEADTDIDLALLEEAP